MKKVSGFVLAGLMLPGVAWPASLKVRSFPPAAKVFVDGADTGKSTPATIAVTEGEHVVTVQAPDEGWRPETRRVTIVSGNNELAVTLLPVLVQGPPGPQGESGPQGQPGPPGLLSAFDQLAGLPCTAPGGQPEAGLVEVSHRHGAATMRCIDPAVRFVDNGDGTITDHATGLMWEKKVAGSGCLNCVGDAYTWDQAQGEWLDRINGRLLDCVAGSCQLSGFAGHNGWRLPTYGELAAIWSFQPDCSSLVPCIDPAFGPTAPAVYWSTSTIASQTDQAWAVRFTQFVLARPFKTDPQRVRAVRSAW